MPRPPAADDGELMRRIQRDDTVALGALYTRYAGRAYSLARAVCHRADVAEDVVQEAFISLWRSRGTYRAADSDVGGWVMSIVRHRAIDAVRRHHVRDRWYDDPENAREQASAEDIAEDTTAADEARRLRGLLALLPSAQRDVVVLAYYGELTHVEIAAHLDLPLSTVKGRMRLALERLRDSA
jgi:RNA polymerase sigma-70 factor (ECF subfamily)